MGAVTGSPGSRGAWNADFVHPYDAWPLDGFWPSLSIWVFCDLTTPLFILINLICPEDMPLSLLMPRSSSVVIYNLVLRRSSLFAMVEAAGEFAQASGCEALRGLRGSGPEAEMGMW